jgi:hypothetical protein
MCHLPGASSRENLPRSINSLENLLDAKVGDENWQL